MIFNSEYVKIFASPSEFFKLLTVFGNPKWYARKINVERKINLRHYHFLVARKINVQIAVSVLGAHEQSGFTQSFHAYIRKYNCKRW